ncbi:hypothetical protein GEMRC1_000965 [Eukaryota sp. GEM-RC1]
MKVSGLTTENAKLKEKNLEIEQLRNVEIENSRLKVENSKIVNDITNLQKEIERLTKVENQIHQLKTANSKIVNDINNLTGETERSNRGIRYSKPVPQSKMIKFCHTRKHSDLQLSKVRKSVVVEGAGGVNRNILGEHPLLPGNLYTWKLRYQGNTQGLWVGVIDESKFSVDGRCFGNGRCFYNDNAVCGGLSGNKCEWQPGDLLQINVDLIDYTITIKSLSNSSIDLTGTLPRLSSGHYYPYAFLWYSDLELEIVQSFC